MNLRRFTDTGEWTTRRYLSLAGTVLIWLMVAIDAWYMWPTQLGGATSMVIVSGHSMEPTYFGGDLVIARKMEPSIGDVIIYAPAGLGGSQIVHRIIGGNAEDGWEMQGDNNDFVDPFTPRGDEVKGVVLVHYSNFGRITVLLLNPMVWAFVLLAALVLLIWWSDDCEDDDEDEDDEGDDQPESSREPGDTEADAQGSGPPVLDPTGGHADDDAQSALEPEPAARAEADDEGSRCSRLATRVVGIVAALLVTIGVTAGPAAASQLSVTAPASPAAMSYDRCAPGTLAVTASGAHNGNQYAQLQVSGIPAACAGLPMTVYVHRSNGVLVASASGTSAHGTVTFGTSAFNVNQVATAVVKIDGWIFRGTWTRPTPPAAATCEPTNSAGTVVAGTCTVTNVTVVDQWGSPGSRSANANFTVNSSTGYFRLTFDFSQAPLPGWYPHTIGGNLTLPPVSGCGALPLVTVSGPSWSVYQPPSYSYYFSFSESAGNICP